MKIETGPVTLDFAKMGGWYTFSPPVLHFTYFKIIIKSSFKKTGRVAKKRVSIPFYTITSTHPVCMAEAGLLYNLTKMGIDDP